MDDPVKRQLFGVTMRKRRKREGLNMTELSLKIGVSVKTYDNYEAGRCYPSLPVYFRICAALEVGTPPFA